tara:strand:+ start:25 stop:189 length:165 start_codon:yes stop_codon:yes gene_type:complete
MKKTSPNIKININFNLNISFLSTFIFKQNRQRGNKKIGITLNFINIPKIAKLKQ